MAAKRIANSSIDWVRASKVCPKAQLDILRATQAKHAGFMNRVHALPESLPKIDFAAYMGKTDDPTMVARFEKAYKALSIPYPSDKDNVLAAVNKENDAKDAEIKVFKADCQKKVDEAAQFLTCMDTLPDYFDMTNEMYSYYFPELFPDMEERPRFHPYDDKNQWDSDPDKHDYLETALHYGVIPRNKVIPEEDKELIAALVHEDKRMPNTKETDEFCVKHFGKNRSEMANPQLYVIPHWKRDANGSNGVQTMEEQNCPKTHWSQKLNAT